MVWYTPTPQILVTSVNCNSNMHASVISSIVSEFMDCYQWLSRSAEAEKERCERWWLTDMNHSRCGSRDVCPGNRLLQVEGPRAYGGVDPAVPDVGGGWVGADDVDVDGRRPCGCEDEEAPPAVLPAVVDARGDPRTPADNSASAMSISEGWWR